MTKLQSVLLTLLAAILVLLGAYAAGGQAARKAVELERLRTESRSRKRRDENLQKVDSLGDDAVRDLARQRMRHG